MYFTENLFEEIHNNIQRENEKHHTEIASNVSQVSQIESHRSKLEFLVRQHLHDLELAQTQLVPAEKIEQIKSELLSLIGATKSLKEQISVLSEQHEEAQLSAKNATNTAAMLQKNTSDAEKQLLETNLQLSPVDEIQSHLTTINNLREETDDANAKARQLQDHSDALNTELSKTRATLDELTKKSNSLKFAGNQMVTFRKQGLSDIADIESQVKLAQKELDEYNMLHPVTPATLLLQSRLQKLQEFRSFIESQEARLEVLIAQEQ
jgi:chromosome segregation ATPase